MSSICISAEWLEPETIAGPELASTWCSLSIVVADEPITRVYRNKSRSVTDTVAISAYPLAEWIATSWWQLFEERESPEKLEEAAFQATHFLSNARDGYALPNLRLACLGDSCRLSWRGIRLAHSGVEFLGSGTTYVQTEAVRDALSDFVTQVVVRLEENSITDTLLQQQWNAIRNLDTEETSYCRAVAAFGLDPFSHFDHELSERIVNAYQRLPETFVEEISAVANPDKLLSEIAALEKQLEELNVSDSKLRAISGLRSVFQKQRRPQSLFPWRSGYEDARLFRAQLGLNGDPIGTIANLLTKLGENVADDSFSVPGIAVDGVVGLMVVDATSSLAVVFNSRRDESTLFNLGRAIGAYLHNSFRASALTNAVSDVQSRSRAFAAELLAPSSSLKTDVNGTEYVDEERLDELAEKYGVSPFVVHHQLLNHGIARTALQATGPELLYGGSMTG